MPERPFPAASRRAGGAEPARFFTGTQPRAARPPLRPAAGALASTGAGWRKA